MSLINSSLLSLEINVHGVILRTMILPCKLSTRIGLICGSFAMITLCLKRQTKVFALIVENDSGLSLTVNIMDILRLKNLNV